MNSGHLLAQNGTSSGFGWQSIVKRAKSWAWLAVRGQKRRPANSGHHFRRSIGSVPSVIPIFGMPIVRFYLQSGIVRSEKTVGKPIISNVSIIRCANGAVAWCAKRSRSRKNWRIISARSGISSTIITRSNAQNVVSLRLHDYRKPKQQTIPGPPQPYKTNSVSLQLFIWRYDTTRSRTSLSSSS